MSFTRWSCIICTCLTIAGTTSKGDALSDLAAETEFRTIYDASPVNVVGRIVDADGTPLYGATVRLEPSMATTVTDTNGTYHLNSVHRHNQTLIATKDGFRDEVRPLVLRHPLSVTEVHAGTLVMTLRDPNVVRFLFGGDSALARRYLGFDPAPTNIPARFIIPPDNPEAWIQASDPAPGSTNVVRLLKPTFDTADYPILNLESVVTDNPSTPHVVKDFVYFTLPGSLPAFKWLGVKYVSLGNNHVYDYLEAGVLDTRRHVTEAGLAFSGIGTNQWQAAEPYRPDSAETAQHEYSFISMSSIAGTQSPPTYNATLDKGGAAPLNSNDLVIATITNELASGRIPIAMWHSGVEYTVKPANFARRRMELAAELGVGLVVSHHPHVAQGFAHHHGVLLIQGLGNLFFDQTRLETMYSILVQVDMEGAVVRGAWGIPIYNEDLRPRLIAGRSGDVFMRRLAEFSGPETHVYPYQGRVWITTNAADVVHVERRKQIQITIGQRGWTALDLRLLSDGAASLSDVRTDQPATVRPGRDLMIGGDFEDVDVDDDTGEISRWSHGSTATQVGFDRQAGLSSLASVRKSGTSTTDSVIAYRNRIRVFGDATDTPNKDLSILGYHRGDNAGIFRLVCRYFASFGDKKFGEQDAYTHPAGSYPWTSFAEDIDMPPDLIGSNVVHESDSARALRLFIRHSPPPSGGQGILLIDELAVVNWEESYAAELGATLQTPHARDFLRVEAAPGTTVTLDLTFRSYVPRIAAPPTAPLIFLR